MATYRAALVALLMSIAPLAIAAEPETQPAVAEFSLTPVPAPDSVDTELAEAAARPAGILKYGPVSILDPMWKKLNSETQKFGLNVGLAYTALYQGATGGPGRRHVAGEDIDLFGDWRLLGEKDGKNNGYIYFAAEVRNDLSTKLPPGSLKGQIGSLWGTTNGFGEQDLVMKELYWQQHIEKDKLIVRIGKLDPENHYNSNYWQSDSKYFVNAAFSSFPVRAFPGQGVGVNVTAKLSDQWYISTGAQDAQGKKTTVGLNTFFEDTNLFGAFEVGYTPTIEKLGRGTYRFTAWYRDAGERDGKSHDSGFDISFDQKVGPHLVPFFRAGIGEGNINGIDDMISGGIGWQNKLITEADVFGIGAAWGRPSNHDLDDQYTAEVFYRLQVSPDNQLTIGYQVILDPSNNPNDDVVGVFEVRWRITM